MPAADGYYGVPAEHDVRYQVEMIKQLGVEVLSIYLGELSDEQRESFSAMYPDYVEVKEMDRLIPVILEGIFQMMSRSCAIELRRRLWRRYPSNLYGCYQSPHVFLLILALRPLYKCGGSS